eukprot:CAMPEP_0182571986 /NCGR_PEP_ID=MMETSP1324-20130603/15727_1 /TAXON_ID=236786 /ORGANISM="Florenciella sp., Strain RCC1587" /LENGTH=39 /DNA_ID= /DNA_START= /DNA_END= /DNA_ORIENTATION=
MATTHGAHVVAGAPMVEYLYMHVRTSSTGLAGPSRCSTS